MYELTDCVKELEKGGCVARGQLSDWLDYQYYIVSWIYNVIAIIMNDINPANAYFHQALIHADRLLSLQFGHGHNRA